jgi:hypothetical protein
VGHAQQGQALHVEAQTSGRDTEVRAAVGALQAIAQSGSVALDHEVLDAQADVGKGLPQRLVEGAQAVVALQAGRIAVQDHVGVVGVEERVVVVAIVEAGEGVGRQRADVVVAHRRYMSWPPLTAQTWPVM